MAVDREADHFFDQRFRPNAISQAPSGHGISFRPAVQHDEAIAKLRVTQKADMPPPVIEHAAIDLVRQDGDVRMRHQPFDKVLDLFLGHRAACRVAGAVENYQPRSWRDLREHFARLEGKAVLLFERDWNRHRAGIFDHRTIDRKSWVWIKNFAAWFSEHEDREKHCRLAARHDDHGVRVNLDIVAFVQIGGDGFAQGQDPLAWRIAMMTVTQGFLSGLDNMLRCAEIGLANPEIDNIAALPFKLGGAGKNLKRRLGPQMVHIFVDLQHSSLLP